MLLWTDAMLLCTLAAELSTEAAEDLAEAWLLEAGLAATGEVEAGADPDAGADSDTGVFVLAGATGAVDPGVDEAGAAGAVVDPGAGAAEAVETGVVDGDAAGVDTGVVDGAGAAVVAELCTEEIELSAEDTTDDNEDSTEDRLLCIEDIGVVLAGGATTTGVVVVTTTTGVETAEVEPALLSVVGDAGATTAVVEVADCGTAAMTDVV